MGLNTAQMYVALRDRYAGDAWAFLTEVPNGTGYSKSRSADAMAMSLWPSRGLELHGIEVKVSRNDWLKELNNPQKAEDFANYTDRWWLAVGDAAIVKDGELPPTWGLLIPKGNKLVQKIAAPKLQAIEIDRCFMAGLLRRATEQLIPKSEQQEALRAEYDRGYKSGQEMAAHQVERAKVEKEQAEQTLKNFETASGLHIQRWNAGDIGRLVSFLKTIQTRADFKQRIADQMHAAKSEVEKFEQVLAELEKVPV